jgi:hypothetical protein
MFVSSLSYEPGFPPAWEGLDYESAKRAVPHWYGVSLGDGNDGVSHIYANFYVRTCEPFRLAQAAMLSEFKAGEGQEWALEAMEIDGEAEYTISAVIYDPPDDSDDSDRDHSECDDGEDCEGCSACEPDETESWSSANGAWLICEIFPVEPDDMRSDVMAYDSLSDAFTAELLALTDED